MPELPEVETIVRDLAPLLAGRRIVACEVVAGLVVKGTAGGVELCGRLLRLVQTGSVQTYAFLFAVGLALLLAVMGGW